MPMRQGLQYIAQTSRSIKTRIKEHRGNIRNFKQGTPTDTTVSRHFNTANHNQTQLKWMVLEVVQPSQRGGDMRKYLLQKEGFWIKRLKGYCHGEKIFFQNESVNSAAPAEFCTEIHFSNSNLNFEI
ncbi:hypothetical protein XELAEV_18032469mg [Xenopus laevis]|uniref:GIY-YIG domain-containing protein n=1 Tax=Xenopus laevis TaxID=8355 RepID=A0A974HGP5_XENLA|nr:hypothetical protein XELAEV_18032469mg [Xenopus laevis]